MAELRLTLRSDLCAGSGEATGVTVDADLCIDEQGFPYVPARRLKGVLLDAAEWLVRCGGAEGAAVKRLFGTPGAPGQLRLSDAVLPGVEAMRACLGDALPRELRDAAAPLNIARLFTSVRGQTRMENGVAVDGTLRFTRVLDRHNALDPERDTELVARAELAPGADEALLRRCCAAVRHLGTDRNRGLGNVRLSLEPDAAERALTPPALPPEGERLAIEYTLSLDAPLTLPGCAELLDEVPGRSVVGCLAAQCGPEDPDFADLFLNGTVRWSALTPRVGGVRSTPAPLSLVRLRNGDFANRATTPRERLAGQKQKTVDGSYAALTENGPRLARAASHTVYHHSHKGETLYMQESLDAGQLYSGRVEVPRRLAERVLALLCTARFSFGRSKTAQYGRCTLLDAPQVRPLRAETPIVPAGEAVWVLLDADLMLTERGVLTADPAAVRRALAELLKLEDALPAGAQDYAQTRTLSGYHAKWNLPKPQLPAVRGGSLFAFRAKGGPIPAVRQLGAYPQEGLGAFRVLTAADLKRYNGAKKGQPDRRAPQPGSEGEALLQAMAAAELDRVFAEAVSALYREQGSALSVRAGTLGRVRQMVAEAADYDDLLRRIDSIKPSDRHSDNLVPDKEKALELVNEVQEHTVEKHGELLRRAGARGEGLWKRPILQMIHLLYYGKGEG